MPPQETAAVAFPFLTDTFDPSVMRDEVGFTRMPDMQLVVVVTPSTLPSSVPVKKIPSRETGARRLVLAPRHRSGRWC